MSSETAVKKIVHIHLPEESAFTTTLTAGKHELIADEPDHVPGGKDRGPDPYDYLLMALGSCTAMTIKMYARRKNWPLEDLYVELRHNKRHAEDCEHCEERNAKLDHIEVELIAKGTLSDEQLARLLEISKKCPVHRTLMNDIQIKSNIELR